MRWWNVALLCLMSVGVVSATHFVIPKQRPWVCASDTGRCILKLVPAEEYIDDNQRTLTSNEAFAVAYEISKEGDFVELWRGEGWFWEFGFLSDDGRYFVGLRYAFREGEGKDEAIIAFYDHGKLLREYQLTELLSDTEKIEEFLGMSFWKPSVQTKPDGFTNEINPFGDDPAGEFHLVLIDRTEISFDYTTGEILSKGIDEGAKSSDDLIREEDERKRRRGQELYESSGLKELLEPQFAVGSIEGDWYMTGVTPEGPHWEADLTPKRDFGEKVDVSVVATIAEEDKIVFSLTPVEILGAVEKVLSHPFVHERFEKGAATGIRFRVSGVRLHWNTEDLAAAVEEQMGEAAKEEDLRGWIEFIVDAKEPRYTSGYFDTKTGELLWKKSFDLEFPFLWQRWEGGGGN